MRWSNFFLKKSCYFSINRHISITDSDSDHNANAMRQSKELLERINKVVRHIEQAIDREMSLDELASIACFSPFHFQRVFKEIIGETPKQFIKRLRLEEAARLIAFHPDRNILSVALQVGFQSLEVFSRAFKDYYSISPDTYRKSSESERFRITQMPYTQQQTGEKPVLDVVTLKPMQDFDDLSIEIVTRPPIQCVYLKTTLQSPKMIDESFKSIKQWSQIRDLPGSDATPFGVIKDYPIFTALDKCRFFTCIAVDNPAKISGIVNHFAISSKKYATFTIEGGIADIVEAAKFLVHAWMPGSGYEIVLEPVILIPLKDPTATPFKENSWQTHIPIQPEGRLY